MVSTQGKIDRLEGLLDTVDISDREDDFIRTLVYHRKRNTLEQLSDKQIAWMERLFDEHFGG
jgi:hypothetical protein